MIFTLWVSNVIKDLTGSIHNAGHAAKACWCPQEAPPTSHVIDVNPHAEPGVQDEPMHSFFPRVLVLSLRRPWMHLYTTSCLYNNFCTADCSQFSPVLLSYIIYYE